MVTIDPPKGWMLNMKLFRLCTSEALWTWSKSRRRCWIVWEASSEVRVSWALWKKSWLNPVHGSSFGDDTADGSLLKDCQSHNHSDLVATSCWFHGSQQPTGLKLVTWITKDRHTGNLLVLNEAVGWVPGRTRCFKLRGFAAVLVGYWSVCCLFMGCWFWLVLIVTVMDHGSWLESWRLLIMFIIVMSDQFINMSHMMHLIVTILSSIYCWFS